MSEAPEAGEVKEISPTEKIVGQCQKWHWEFNEQFWSGKDSFHNAEHIQATILAAEKLIEAALAGNDPLGIMKDLEKWNKQHPGSEIKKKELLDVVKLAFAFHDLGNIAQETSTQPDGKIELDFLDKYQAKGAEERSQKIAEAVIMASDIPPEQKKRFLPFVLHLISETTYMPRKEAPFGIFVRVVDQIGNDLFSKNERRVNGLLEEMYAENPDAEFLPYFFFNFARERFEQLVPDDDTRDSILKIWDKKLPEEKRNLGKKPIKVRKWLQR